MTVFDYETSIINKGHPFTPGNFSVSFAVREDNGKVSFAYYTDPDYRSRLRRYIAESSELVVFAGKFDVHWLWNDGIEIPQGCKLYDCSIAEYVLTGQRAKLVSLNQCLEEYGLPRKFDKIAQYWEAGISTEFIPVSELEEYNRYDVQGTWGVYQAQLKLLTPLQLKLVYKMGEDLLALAEAERNGVKWDSEKASSKLVALASELDNLERSLNGYLPSDLHDPICFNWDSGDQLSAFLYGGTITYAYAESSPAVYLSGEKKGDSYIRNRWFEKEITFQRRFTPIKDTELKKTAIKVQEQTTRLYQTDDPTLKQLACVTKEQKSIIGNLQSRAAIQKVIEMIESINKRFVKYHWENLLIHGRFNQTIVATGRLSSSDPNMQNTPEDVDELFVSRYD